MILWFVGNSGSGKSWLAKRVLDGLPEPKVHLDGDETRKIWTDLGFTSADRLEQNYRMARLARLLDGQGLLVVVSTICPFREQREKIAEMTGCRFVYLPGGDPRGTEFQWPE